MTRARPPGEAERRRRRHAADRRLRWLARGAVGLTLGTLGLLLLALVATSLPALTTTTVRVDFPLDPALVDPADPAAGDFRAVVARGAAALFPDASPEERAAALHILTPAAPRLVRRAVLRDPARIGGTLVLAVPAADPYDQLAKGRIDRAAPEAERRLGDADIARFDRLAAGGRVSRPLNTGLLLNTDSQYPEMAGLLGAIVGSLMTLAVCLGLSLPIGIATAVLLEEFAPPTRLTGTLRANIDNLAAVPPIVFGLLALAVLIGGLGLPRSSPLVAGLALGLMTLPTAVIATRGALLAVPRPIREAAFALGASRHQVVLHHVLPLAAPGILTGALLALTQALGEAAPLLLIGMNAFITSVPGDATDSATTLPTQILLWAGSPESGFAARAAAAILVLLVVLVLLNTLARVLRHRLQRAR